MFVGLRACLVFCLYANVSDGLFACSLVCSFASLSAIMFACLLACLVNCVYVNVSV